MEEKESFCLLCSLGCKFALKVDKGMALSSEFSPDYPLNEGRLCPKGLYALELLNHPQRLLAPRIRDNGKLKEISWQEILHSLADKIKEIKSRYGSQAIGVVIDPNHTNEEILAAQDLARMIGTANFACSLPPNDSALLRVLNITPAGKAESLQDVNCSLIVGDLFVRHPVLAKRIIDAKYKARGNNIIVLDPQRTNTAWFANTHLQNKPGSEALVLVGLLKIVLRSSKEETRLREKLERISDDVIAKTTGISMGQIKEVARTFNDAEKGVLILSPGLKGIGNVELTAGLCALLAGNIKGNKSFMPLFTFGNAVGAFKMGGIGGGKGLPQLIEEMARGKIKLLIDFGEDLLSSQPSAIIREALRRLDFLTVSFPFVPVTEPLAHMVLPCAIWLEKSGTINFFDGRREFLEPCLSPPGAAKSDLTLISELAQELGASLDKEGLKKKAEARSDKEVSERREKQTIDELFEQIDDLIKEITVEDKEYPYFLITSESTVHFADGSITRNLSWAKEEFPSPFIKLSIEDARELGIKDGEEVLVISRSGQIALTAQVTDRLRSGAISAPSYFPEIRSILSWKLTPEGEVETLPERVSLQSKRGNVRK